MLALVVEERPEHERVAADRRRQADHRPEQSEREVCTLRLEDACVAGAGEFRRQVPIVYAAPQYTDEGGEQAQAREEPQVLEEEGVGHVHESLPHSEMECQMFE